MTYELNETHHPDASSWVESANQPGSDFPVQNLPFGVFRRHQEPHIGVAIGDQIFDVHAWVQQQEWGGKRAEQLRAASSSGSLNLLMSLGQSMWEALRLLLFRVLREQSPVKAAAQNCLLPQSGAEMLVPAEIGDYTDFYASLHHALNVGTMLRPGNPLLPNYKYLPIGYHGRASSIVPSGTAVLRPYGQLRDDPSQPPVFAPSRRLDYELEVGCYVGPGNQLGEPIPLADAESHLFGLCLVNDWSARDLQLWEYQPLGPFLAKSFATSVSPWVVTAEALLPFRCPPAPRSPEDPAPFPYLSSENDRQNGAFDITLEVYLASQRMRDAALPRLRLSRGNFRDMYWTLAQLLAHHTSNGCNLRPGDLLASGTISGPGKEARGCLLELTWRGAEPIELPTGEQRCFLESGDEITLLAYCEKPGFARIGFGECRGTIS